MEGIGIQEIILFMYVVLGLSILVEQLVFYSHILDFAGFFFWYVVKRMLVRDAEDAPLRLSTVAELAA